MISSLVRRSLPRFRRRAGAGVTALSAAALVLAGCGGDNLFRTEPLGSQLPDTKPPVVVVEFPADGSSLAVGDSLFSRVRLTDNRALRSVEISGFALRGDPALGTQQKVARFVTRRVEFNGRAVTDTIVGRFLTATADSLPESRVYVVATAQDTSGNVSVDTAFVALVRGPAVQITAPAPDSAFRAGGSMRVRVAAEDAAGGVTAVRLRASGAFAADTTLTLASPLTRVDTSIVLAVPVTAEGPVQLDASAVSGVSGGGSSGIVGSAQPVRVRAVLAPTVKIDVPTAGATVAVKDSLFARVRVGDNRGLRLLSISGFALRGDPALGTQQKVARFVTKTVRLDSLGYAVTDTLLTRYLLPTADSLPESRVYVVATAQDTSGNVSADTVAISIGGPRVQIVAPRTDSTFRAGSPLTVRLSAEDRTDRISSLRLRAAGAFSVDTTLTLRSAAVSVDTSVVLEIPQGAQGDLHLDAAATSTQRIQGTSPPVRVRVLPATADNLPPRVSFTASIASRMELTDSLSVSVTGTDETRLDTLGVTILALRQTAAGADTLAVLTGRTRVSPPTQSATFRFGLAPLGLSGLDTVTVSFEVAAFARDAAGNCATATAPGSLQSLPCRTLHGTTISDQPGALSSVLIVRGRTIAPPSPGDTLADLASDRLRVFASNRTRNRVEVIPVGSTAYASPVLVGSQPWGLAITPDTGTLLVANSGGAGSISRVAISPASVPSADDLSRRIITENVVLYVVKFTIDAQTGRVNLRITDLDFSDRPQFLAQTASGRILYSTVPTAAAPDGTVQQYNPNGPEPTTDLFVEYARGFVEDQFVVRRADGVSKFIRGSGNTATDQLVICDHAPGQPKGSLCFPRSVNDTLTFQQIQDSLRIHGADAFLDFNVDPTRVGLTDTTFLAVSKDHRTVAVGEGVRSIGRVLSFAEDLAGNVSVVGNTRDLLNNASDRVIGLGLNRDGSVGLARGNTVSFFRQDLRLLGNRLVSGTPSGGVAMHPNHPDVPLAFVSGVDESGRPFIDVVDSNHFVVRRRLFIRNPVNGSLIAVPTGASTGVVVRLYAITAAGVVGIELTDADLQ